MGDAEDDPPDLAALDTEGADVDDPYVEADGSALPEWWREAIEEFRRHGLRPYRPPRFTDGVLKYTVVERLEETHGVDIDFIGVDVSHGDDWTVRVDDESIGTIGHHRSSDAYTVFEMDSDEFVDWVIERI